MFHVSHGDEARRRGTGILAVDPYTKILRGPHKFQFLSVFCIKLGICICVLATKSQFSSSVGKLVGMGHVW